MTHSTNFAFVYIFADVPTTPGFLPFDWKSLTVVAQLGSGAFGSIHYAKYEGNEKSVVLKSFKRASAVMPKVALLEKQRCFSV